MNRACYRSLRNYKYQLVKPYKVKLALLGYDAELTKLVLSPDGTLLIRKGYCWDGPSGPTIDTLNFMRGSLIHDALYQLIRERKVLPSQRKTADRILREILLADGMSRVRAWYAYRGVRWFGAGSAKPGTQKPVVITCVPIRRKVL